VCATEGGALGRGTGGEAIRKGLVAISFAAQPRSVGLRAVAALRSEWIGERRRVVVTHKRKVAR